MTPRKASLRVAHQASCPQANKTSISSIHGCKCGPSFYTFHRDRDGRAVKGSRLRDRRVAERELRALQVKIDEGRLEHADAPRKDVTLPEWAATFEQLLDGRVKAGDLAARSQREYMDSVRRAVDAIGHEPLRQIGPPELRRFYDTLTSLTPAGRLRHLRHFNLCLEAATDDGLMETNPLPKFKKKLRLRLPKRGKAPFEDGELARMWTAYRELEIADVYLYLSRFAVESGLRLGEAVALDWRNVDLAAGTVYVEHTYSDVAGLGKPKGHKERTVYLTTEARKVLEEWLRVSSVNGVDELSTRRGQFRRWPGVPEPGQGRTARPAQRRAEPDPRDGEGRRAEGASRTAAAALVPQPPLHDVGADAAARPPPAVHRADLRARLPRVDVRGVWRVDAGAVASGGGADELAADN